MPFLMAPRTMPTADLVKKARETAAKIVLEEKEIRIGTKGDAPSKFFIFKHDGSTVGVCGEVFGKTMDGVDPRDQTALLIKLVAHALDSSVVMHICEGWSCCRCHQCGANYPDKSCLDDGWKCSCGAPRCTARENPHRQEILTGVLTVFGGKQNRGYLWSYTFKRDQNGEVVGFDPTAESVEGPVDGCMTRHWFLDPWEIPHFLVNYPNICRSLGVECDPRAVASAKLVLSLKPRDYKILQFGVTDSLEELSSELQYQADKEAAPFN